MLKPKSLFLTAGAGAILAATAGAQFSADFEDPPYLLGPLEGQTIWTNWGGINGTETQVVNTMNHTPGGSQAIEIANGADTVADFDMLAGGSFDSGQWTVSIQTFVPNGSTGEVFFLMMNQWDVSGTPAPEWNVQVGLAAGSNRVVTDTPNGETQNPIIKDAWVEIRCEYDLDANVVSVFYNNELQDSYDPRCGVLMGCASPASGSFIDAIDLFPSPGSNPSPIFFDDITVTQGISGGGVFSPYCFGDGSGTTCPCGNTGGADEGCGNTSGAGAKLSGAGSTSLSADDAVYTGENMLAGQPGVLFFGNNATNNGDGVTFGDGLRCAGGSVIRRGVQVPDGSGVASWGPGLMAGTGVSAGDTRRWQIWYRDPSGGGACGNSFNLSQGLETIFSM